ncbi:unnamed protein product [Hymenolepis diminuta]|uniref:Uncharacterized protein n=1 Tax=Hymenolepis diminuta TaxID=6216 RepID=A0A564Y0F4_HYMDI|nr:unnamed protein product [Hymenolepis diminuta]
MAAFSMLMKLVQLPIIPDPKYLRPLPSFLQLISNQASFLPALHVHRGPPNQLLHKDTPWE